MILKKNLTTTDSFYRQNKDSYKKINTALSSSNQLKSVAECREILK